MQFFNIQGVCGIHHIHIWDLGTSENAMNVHVAVNDVAQSEQVKAWIRELLQNKGITHVKIETEPKDYICRESHCFKQES